MAFIVRRNVFICYSHKDAEHLGLLQEHLEGSGLKLSLWADTKIDAGQDWQAEIGKALSNARAAVLFVSASFMNSTFIQQRELPLLLDRANNDLDLIPVQIRPTAPDSRLASIRFLNSPDKPFSEMTTNERERMWVKLVERLRKLEPVEEAQGEGEDSVEPPDDEPLVGDQPHMSNVARSLLTALLPHQRSVKGRAINEAVIAYKDIYRRARVGFNRRWAGQQLFEIDEWCRANHWPPLNALVVNGKSRRPGATYPSGRWEREVQAVLSFDYPDEVLNPP